MKELSQIVVFPRGQLQAKDRERLTKAGIIAVEAECPQDVRVLIPSSSMVSGDDLLMAALDGITEKYAAQCSHEKFVRSLHARLTKKDLAQ